MHTTVRIVTLTLMCIAVSGCASEVTVRRQLPREVVLTPETGQYEIVLDPHRWFPDSPLPDTVPLFTRREGVLIEGLKLERQDFENPALLPWGFPEPGSSRAWAIFLPSMVEPTGKSWSVQTFQHFVSSDVLSDFESKAIPTQVPVDPPGPARPKVGLVQVKGLVIPYE
jgi:hypothetical protein